jgi:hypothetical protein
MHPRHGGALIEVVIRRGGCLRVRVEAKQVHGIAELHRRVYRRDPCPITHMPQTPASGADIANCKPRWELGENRIQERNLCSRNGRVCIRERRRERERRGGVAPLMGLPWKAKVSFAASAEPAGVEARLAWCSC